MIFIIIPEGITKKYIIVLVQNKSYKEMFTLKLFKYIKWTFFFLNVTICHFILHLLGIVVNDF